MAKRKLLPFASFFAWWDNNLANQLPHCWVYAIQESFKCIHRTKFKNHQSIFMHKVKFETLFFAVLKGNVTSPCLYILFISFLATFDASQSLSFKLSKLSESLSASNQNNKLCTSDLTLSADRLMPVNRWWVRLDRSAQLSFFLLTWYANKNETLIWLSGQLEC